VGNLHVNFTIVVYSPTNITSLFYPVSKFSYFCICDTPLNWPQQIWAENWVGLCPFGGGELGPRLTQCGRGRGLPACQVSSWSVKPFGHNTPTLQTGQDRQTTVR